MKNNSNFQKLLQDYSLLGAACLASGAAQAQIVYTDVPDNTFGPNETCFLDLNNDGTTDFQVLNVSYLGASNYWDQRAVCFINNGNYQVLDEPGFGARAFNLSFGNTIDSNGKWSAFGTMAEHTYEYGTGTSGHSFTEGNWINISDGYLGLRIKLAGEYHYGWARFDAQLGSEDGSVNSLTLKDYAYNTQPNQPILAGQTTSCTDNYEPNNSKQQAVQIQSNQEYQALISPALDFDWFKVSVTATQPNVRVLLLNLPGNFNILLYDPSGNKIGSSKNLTTNPDTIVANGLTPGTYYVKVRGKAGHFDPDNCYSLKVETSASPWKLSSLENQVADEQFELFPNPASEQLSIQCNDENIEFVDVTIYNIFGQQARTLNHLDVHNGQSTLDVSELAQGEYLLRIYSEDGLEVKKFIVNR